MQDIERRQQELRDKLEAEQRQRTRRERLADAQIRNAQGIIDEDGDAIFSPIDDFVETRRPITRLFFSVYDNLGVLMAVNLFTLVCSFPLILFFGTLLTGGDAKHHIAAPPPPYILLVLGVIIASPAWAAASSYCSRIVEGEMNALSYFWRDYRRFLGKGILLGVGQWLVGAMLFYATGWYLGQAGSIKFVGVISLYLIIFWALAGMYLWPLMVRGYRWRAILRNAGVLVIASPIRTTILLIVLLILTVVLTLSGVGLVLLMFSLWAMLPNQALVLTREKLEARRLQIENPTTNTKAKARGVKQSST